jgi:hypothetical protein
MTDTVTETSGVSEPESGRHPVNVGHLVMGIALLGLVVSWALVVGDVVEGEDVRWLLPTPWVLAGAAGLIALAINGRRGNETRQVGWVAPAESPDDTEAIPVDTDDTDTTTTDITTEETR